MRNFVLNNFDAFYTMLVSTLVMSNENSAVFANDANKIIDFIGRAYDFDEEKLEKCKQLIDDMSELSLKCEALAFYGRQKSQSQMNDSDFFLSIKCEALCEMDRLVQNKNILPEWFDYSHYQSYAPQKRFYIMQTVGSTGEMITARQTAILLALGIGHKVDFEEAEYRLLQCTYWGDIPSAHLLKEVYRLQNKTKEYDGACEIVDLLERYLTSGRINLNSQIKARYSVEAVETYSCISAIKNEVINSMQIQNIDYSFVEVLMNDDLPFERKMNFINFYSNFEWKMNRFDAVRAKVGF